MHSGGCAGTAEYYRNTRETLLVQKEYYRSYREAVLVLYSTREAVLLWHRGTGEAVLVQKSAIGALGKLCWYSRLL